MAVLSKAGKGILTHGSSETLLCFSSAFVALFVGPYKSVSTSISGPALPLVYENLFLCVEVIPSHFVALADVIGPEVSRIWYRGETVIYY